MTYAQGKNLETCAWPEPCCQPAVVEREFYYDDEEDPAVTLGFCIPHGEAPLYGES